MLVGIIGFVSLGTEIVLLLSTSRHMQSAADAGVLAAVTARTRGYPADYRQEAFALAAAAGFANGVDGTTVAVNSPPTTGSFTTESGAVEVLIAQPRILPLASVVYSEPFTVRARSVARASGSGSCILTLDTTASDSFSMTGGTVADIINCDVSVNSSSVQAVSLVGGAVLNAGYLYDVGEYTLTGGAQIKATIATHAPPTPDPYASRVMPPAAVTCMPDPDVKTTRSISPGTYCSISVGTNNGKLTLTPGGNYIVNGGSLNVGAGATLTGAGVTIVLTGSGANYATADIGGGSTVTLTAPTTGASAGLAFFQDRNAPTSGINKFNGGTGQSISGALYFPRQPVRFSGGAAANITCIQIIARTLAFTGNATMKVDCAGTGVVRIGGGSAGMVE